MTPYRNKATAVPGHLPGGDTEAASQPHRPAPWAPWRQRGAQALFASLALAAAPFLLGGGTAQAQENPPRRITLDEGDPVRIIAPGGALESRTGPAGASQRVEVRTAWGRYCITDHRNNPILADAFATPGSGGTGNFGIPTNCPP